MIENRQNIAGRMEDFFGRHIASLRQAMSDLQSFQENFTEDHYDSLVEIQEKSAGLSDSLAKEFAALKREWDETEGIGVSERERIQALSDEAGTLTEKVQCLLQENGERVATKSREFEAAIAELRQGRGVLHKYRLEDPSSSNHMDRNA